MSTRQEKRINCYFYGKKAIHTVESVDPRNLRIRCEHYKVYEHEILLFHHSKEMILFGI